MFNVLSHHGYSNTDDVCLMYYVIMDTVIQMMYV